MKKLLVVGIGILLIGFGLMPNINAKIDSPRSSLYITRENATAYIGWTSAEFYRFKIDGFFVIGNHVHGHSSIVKLEFDSNVTELDIKVVIDYEARMNYSFLPNIVLLSPFAAFGLKVDNYTDYSWEYFKLKHEKGLFERKGNISVNITLDTSNVSKGDEIRFEPTIVTLTDPFLVNPDMYPNFPKKVSLLLRFAYLIPGLHKKLLEPYILPFYAKFKFNSFSYCPIVVDFV